MRLEISRCFPWLSRHHQGEKQDGFETLLDDVVVDVLSRLEVDQLGRAKRVCRMWRALIGTAHFTRVHLQRASSVTVMCSMFSERRAVDMPFLFYYNWGTREKIRGAKLLGLRPMRRTIHSYCDLLGCCDGLLIFVGPLSNSMYGDLQPRHAGGNQLAERRLDLWFLSPFAFERIPAAFLQRNSQWLLVSRGRSGASGVGRSRDVSLSSQRTRSPVRHKGSSSLDGGREGTHAGPCLHSIKVFSTGESEFRFMPHPGDSCLSSHGHSNMHLVERNGRVYVCAIHVEVMCVWVLEDYASWHWVKKCDIDLEWGLNRHPEFVTSYTQTPRTCGL